MMKRKLIIIVGIAISALCLTACSMFPTYYSREEVESIAKAVVGDDINYISEEKNKDKKRITYTFEDNKGRKFTYITYSKHPDFIDGASLPGYGSRMVDSYLKSIYMHHKEEIDAILYPAVEEAGWELTRYDCVTKTSDISWQVLNSPVKIYLKSTEYGAVNHEDSMRALAKLGAQLDAILAFEYSNEKLKEYDDILYRYQLGGGFQLDFMEDKRHISIVSFAFSTSEETRWTEESLYEYLKQQYDEDVKQ